MRLTDNRHLPQRNERLLRDSRQDLLLCHIHVKRYARRQGCSGAPTKQPEQPRRLLGSNNWPPADNGALDRRVYLFLHHEHQRGRQHASANLRGNALRVVTAVTRSGDI